MSPPNIRQYKIRSTKQAEEIMEALAWLSELDDPQQFKRIDSAVMAFFTSTNCGACKRIVEALRNALLTDEANHILVLQEAEARNTNNLEAEALFHAFRCLLGDCRKFGVEAAFAKAARHNPDRYGW